MINQSLWVNLFVKTILVDVVSCDSNMYGFMSLLGCLTTAYGAKHEQFVAS